MLLGVSFDTSQVIGETLERATPEIDVSATAIYVDTGAGGWIVRVFVDPEPGFS